MPGVITLEELTTRVCHALGVPPRNDAESLTEMLRTALVESRSAAIAAAKTVCLEIAEDEAEQCRRVGATTAQQTALSIAARIRKAARRGAVIAVRGGWARPRRRVARRDPLHCDRGQK